MSCFRDHHDLTSSSLIFNYLMIRKGADKPPNTYWPLNYHQIAGKLVKSRWSWKRLMIMLRQCKALFTLLKHSRNHDHKHDHDVVHEVKKINSNEVFTSWNEVWHRYIKPNLLSWGKNLFILPHDQHHDHDYENVYVVWTMPNLNFDLAYIYTMHYAGRI